MKKTTSVADVFAKKGEAVTATDYPGDEEQATPANTKKVPARYQLPKTERRSDAIYIRVTPSERERIEAMRDRLGCSITQAIVFALDALEEDLDS